MSLDIVLNELIAERDRLNAAIAALNGSQLQAAKPTRKGKGAQLAVLTVKKAVGVKKRTVSPAARKKMAEAAKARWAERKATAKKA